MAKIFLEDMVSNFGNMIDISIEPMPEQGMTVVKGRVNGVWETAISDQFFESDEYREMFLEQVQKDLKTFLVQDILKKMGASDGDVIEF